MKARLIRHYGKMYLLCFDGTIEDADNDVLRMLFVGFSAARHFHGRAGRWDAECTSMEEYPGKSLAWVDDKDHLVVAENVFVPLVEAVVEDDYVTVQEYASDSGRSEARIKILCKEGRIPGAVKKGSRWFIPRTAKLPQDARFSGIEK